MEKSVKFYVTRRALLKGTAAVCAASAVCGCTKPDNSGDSLSEITGAGLVPPPITETVLPGTTAHNCGGRCLTQAYVKDGVIRRFITDERPDIKILDGDDMQYRACSRCRSYKGRLYHPGRLQYPMIQTGQRGDLSSFKKVTWTEAIGTIAAKMNEIRDKYGPQGFYSMYASGSIGWNHCNGMLENVLKGFGGYIQTKNNYSSHQRNYMRDMNGARFRTSRGSIIQTDTIVLWGSHFTATRNSRHWPMMQAKEEVHRKGGKLYYIGPTMEDSNASYADEWVPIRPGTDGALALAIMYEMYARNLLDEEFVKKAVYGFYPCKSYWVDSVTGGTAPADPFGAQSNQNPNDPAYKGRGNWKYIEEVPAGSSLLDYLKGETYTAVNGTDTCKYPYKAHVKTPKSAAWAAGVTGINEASIVRLATDVYGQKDKRVFTERSYGLQRQYNGIYTYHAIDTLIAVSGHWGLPGTGLDYYSKSFNYDEFNPGFPSLPNPVPSGLSCSCTLWHEVMNGGERFGGLDGDLRNNFCKIKYDKASNQFVKDAGGRYIVEKADGDPIKVTPKMIFNIAGNMLVNQHMNIPNTVSWLTDRSKVECIVVYDNFMTASARYADIVLPADMNWEREDIGWNDDDDEIMVFASKAVNPPGNVQSIHFFARELAKALDSIGTGFKGASLYDRITFKDQPFSGGKNMTEEEILKYMWNRGAPRYSFDELKRRGILNVNKEGAERVENMAARNRIDAGGNVIPSQDFTAVGEVGISRSGKFHAYALNIVNEYNNRGMKGYDSVDFSPVPAKDDEGDQVAFPIPVFIPLEQGLLQTPVKFDLTAGAGKERTLMMLSTHSKYRSHSTHNENAWLRDLYKLEATADGTVKFAEDYGSYANMPPDPGKSADRAVKIDRPGGTGLARVCINPKDADLRGIKPGEKVKLSNEIGSVYAAAFVTNKVIPGVVIVYQGSWYDPDTDGTDTGGNPNTLTPDLPSYVDSGNAQNAIPVQIAKV